MRARLVAGLDGRIPDAPVRRAVFPGDDLYEAPAEAPSGSTLLLREGEWSLAHPLVRLGAVTLEGKGVAATVLNPGAPEAAVLGSTAELVAPTPSGPQ